MLGIGIFLTQIFINMIIYLRFIECCGRSFAASAVRLKLGRMLS